MPQIGTYCITAYVRALGKEGIPSADMKYETASTGNNQPTIYHYNDSNQAVTYCHKTNIA
jgi:hypothetical protein